MPLQPWSALSARRARRGPDPLVTYLDVRTGGPVQRTELSAISVQNAVAKIANALRDEFDLGPTSAVGVHLPWHWQRSLWWGGCAAIGARVVPFGRPGEVDLVVGTLAAVLDLPDQREALVVSEHPLGLPTDGPLPDGCIDAASIVRAQPDLFLPDASMPVDIDLAADFPTGQRTLVACTSAGAQLPESWMWPLAIPLAADGSVVMVSVELEPVDLEPVELAAVDLEPVDLDRLAAAERAEAIVILDAPADGLAVDGP